MSPFIPASFGLWKCVQEEVLSGCVSSHSALITCQPSNDVGSSDVARKGECSRSTKPESIVPAHLVPTSVGPPPFSKNGGGGGGGGASHITHHTMWPPINLTVSFKGVLWCSQINIHQPTPPPLPVGDSQAMDYPKTNTNIYQGPLCDLVTVRMLGMDV